MAYNVTDEGEGNDGYTYTILHPRECPTFLTHSGDTGHECLIGMQVDAVGIREAVGVEENYKTGKTTHLPPGDHPIVGFTESFHNAEGHEYSQGIDFVESGHEDAYCGTCREFFAVPSNPPYAVIHRSETEHLHAIDRYMLPRIVVIY